MTDSLYYQKVDEINRRTALLLEYSRAYYLLDNPIISDHEYDKLFDELKALEDETGYWLSNSPTRKVQGELLDDFKKVKHSKPMLSAQKTKSVDEILKWAKGHECYVSYKEDGLTCVISYDNGVMTSAVTRGNGEIGEDVTANARMISNLPGVIPYKGHLELRGEVVIPWRVFNDLRTNFPGEFSHPRNLAAGTIRQLSTSVTSQRQLSYVVFECVTPLLDDNNSQITDDKLQELFMLQKYGFTIVDNMTPPLDSAIKIMTNAAISSYAYPVDGLIIEMRSRKESEAQGATAHHENCRIALKWEDEEVETTLRDVEWNTGRTGMVVPTAIFDTVEIDNTQVSRASIHNKSTMQNLELGIGDTITVYKANQIVPQLADNLTRSNTYKYPTICPSCGHLLEERRTVRSLLGVDVVTLHCTNPMCPAQLLAYLTHFVSRPAMNIDGLSEATLEMLIDNGLIRNAVDIFHLHEYRTGIEMLPGMGKKSVEKLLANIERARNVTMENFIVALGIPQIGKSAAKILAKKYSNDMDKMISEIVNVNRVSWSAETFGPSMTDALFDWFSDTTDMDNYLCLRREVNIFIPEDKPVEIEGDNFFAAKTFCVTGSFDSMKRSEIEKIITDRGGKLTSSVSKNTNILLTNDAESGSSKALKAKELGTPIMDEMEFLSKAGLR